MKKAIDLLTAEYNKLAGKAATRDLTEYEKEELDELRNAIKALDKLEREANQPKVLSKVEYTEKPYGVSAFSMGRVHVLGEQTVQLADGRVVEQHLYDIVGYEAKNGKAFAALKSNIILDK
jgi:hypothetical protein